MALDGRISVCQSSSKFPLLSPVFSLLSSWPCLTREARGTATAVQVLTVMGSSQNLGVLYRQGGSVRPARMYTEGKKNFF